ncbi:hypothetical protein ACNKHL_09845 [Shigella flexneri]
MVVVALIYLAVMPPDAPWSRIPTPSTTYHKSSPPPLDKTCSEMVDGGSSAVWPEHHRGIDTRENGG